MHPASYVCFCLLYSCAHLLLAGKKVFLGTLDGRVLLFDSFTFGLLKQLTDEDEDNAFRHQGAVAGLAYVDRDELLVAAYAAGAVKIFSGCLRHAYAGPKHSSKPQHAKNNEEEFIPHTNGGKPPIRPYLLRECDLGVLPDFSVRTVTVSEGHNLIAVLTKTGVIYLYDYLNLSFLACITLEDDTKQYLCMRFMPLLPVLLIVDNTNTIYAWAVKPMAYRFLLQWNAYDLQYETRISVVFGDLQWNGLEASLCEAFNPLPGSVITTMRCYSFQTHTLTDGSMHLARKWVLVCGNDVGQMLTVNLTDFVHHCGAMEYIPRLDAFYLTYHKMKPRRYQDSSSSVSGTAVIRRTRMPDELIPKLVPIRKDAESTVPDVPVAAPTGAAASGAGAAAGSVKSKLTRQQTRKLKSKNAKKFRLDGELCEYVQGMQGFMVFAQVGVREMDFYDPFYDHLVDRQHHHKHTYVPDLSNVPDRLPVIFVASDQGQVKCVSFNGVCLGDALEEVIETTAKGAPKQSSQHSVTMSAPPTMMTSGMCPHCYAVGGIV